MYPRPRVIQVIESEITVGRGETDDPMYTVIQYHTLDGEFLAEKNYVKDQWWLQRYDHVKCKEKKDE